MAKTKKKGKGVSLAIGDQVAGGGLFGAGEATATEHRFGYFDYNGKAKKAAALLIDYERDGESHRESYTVGNGFKPSEDGTYLIPKGTETGLNNNTKCAQYLRALAEECGMPEDFVTDDISVLDGIVGTLTRKPLEKVEGSDKAGSILVFTEVDEAPWAEGGKKKKKAKKKDEDEDEDDAEDEDDSDVDDDEDDEPKKKKGAAAKGKAKGKAKKSDDDDDEESDDEEDEDSDDDADDEDEGFADIATEALLAALEEGKLKVGKIEEAVLAQTKKNRDKKKIAALAASEKFLKTEAGWTYNAKAKTVSLD